MRRIIEIALEWQTHVFILDGDITKAYDYTQHTLILEALSQRGIPEILSAAILREVARPKGKLRLGGRDSARILQRNRALWQGDPMAPKLFNLTLDQVAVKFENEAKRRKWGWPITVDGRTSHLCLILFADNYWLICTSAKELQDANDFWQKCLKEAGWHTPANELRYGTTLQDDAKASGPVFHNGIQIEHVPRAKGFKALGTQLTFDNRQDAELDRRISAGWGAFYKHAEILCCRSVDLRKRLHYMTKVINPAVFWCAGSWNLRVEQFVKLRGTQRAMIRKMMRFTKLEDEDIEGFMQRTNHQITAVYETYRLISWDVLVRRSVFKWAGWTARLYQHDASRLTLRILRQKDWRWISLVAAQNGDRQLHGRILKTCRWERLIYTYTAENFPGQNWFDLAQDVGTWGGIANNIL